MQVNSEQKEMVAYLTPNADRIQRQAERGCHESMYLIRAYKNVAQLPTSNPLLDLLLSKAYTEYRAKHDHD